MNNAPAAARPGALTILAYLLWTLLLSLAVGRWLQGGEFYFDLYYLIGVPAGMIALTIVLARYSHGSRYRALLLIGASLLAVFAALYWVGVWGAGV